MSFCFSPARMGAVCRQDVSAIDSVQSAGRAKNLQKEENAGD